MSYTPGSGAVISVGVDGASASRRDIDSVGDSLRRLNESNFQKLAGQVTAIQGHIGGVKAAFGDLLKFSVAGFTISTFTDMVKGSIDAADHLNDLSKSTGIAVVNLAGLKLAATQSGGDLDDIAASVNKLSVNMGKDADRFKRLGVTAKEPIEAFKQLADVFSAIQDPQTRAALGAEALGKSWASSAPLLAEGGQKIGEMVARGKALSGMTQEMADRADALNDKLAEFSAASEGAKIKIVGGLLPGLIDATTAITHAYEESGKLMAAWVALGALGAFAFTDQFSSATVQIKNLHEELDDLYLAKNFVSTPGGMLLHRLLGTPAEFDTRIDGARGKIKVLEDALAAPAKAAATTAAQAKADKEAADAKRLADDFIKKGEAAKKAGLAASLELTQFGIEVERNKRAEGLSAIGELNRQGLASDAQYYVAKYNAALASGADVAKVKAAEIATLSAYHSVDLADQIATNGKIAKLNSEKTEALRSSQAAADLIRKQYIYDSDAPVRAAKAAADAEIEAVNKESIALQLQYESYGKLPAVITAMTISKLQAKSAALGIGEGSEAEIVATNQLIEALKTKAKWEGKTTEQDRGSDLTHATELLAVMSALDESAQSAAGGMADSFGKVGSAIGGMTTALSGFARTKAAISAELAGSIQSAYGDPAKIEAAKMKASDASARAQIRQYGDMAGAAKNFFKENSTGYKVMEGAEKAFRAVEMAAAIENMLAKSGLLTAFTGLFVASKATETAATVASVAPDVAASMAKGAAAAAVGVANQAQGDPYSAWPRMAAMAAAMAALGFAVIGGGGSGGDETAEQVQKKQGTGSVFGDSTAKSDSIARSIALASANSSIELTHTAGMLAALRNIEDSMSGLTNLIVRTPGMTDASNMDIQAGTLSKGLVGGFIGEVTHSAVGFLISPVLSLLNNLWGKTTQNVVDSGFQFGGSVRGLQAGQGFNQYASVDTTKSSWFGLSKSTSNSVQTQGIGSELSSQFGLIFTNLETSLKAAAVGIGGSADRVGDVLDHLTLSTSKISLKGLSGDALTSAINGVISKAMDDMASAALPGFDQFRKVGEGYAETVVRVATDYANLDSILQGAGMTFGAVGMTSLAAREKLIDLAGGIDKLNSKSTAYADNFLTQAEKLVPVTKYVSEQMALLGLASVTTRDQFKNVVLGLDLASTAGQTEYVALMNLADAFAKTHAATVDLSKTTQEIADERKDLQNQLDDLTMTSAQLLGKQRAALDASNRALFDQVRAATAAKAAQDAAKTSLSDVIGKMKSFGDSARTLRDGLLTGSLSTLTPEQQYAQTRRQFEQTRASALGGDAAAQSAYSEKVTAFLTASQKVNAGDAQYSADFTMAQHDADSMANWAAGQVDVAQASLDALNDQVTGIAELNATMLSVAQGISKLPAAFSAPMPTFAAPVNYSGMGTLDMAPLVAEIKALREEVAGLRADQNNQTGEGIASNERINNNAAKTVVTGITDAIDVLGRVYRNSKTAIAP